MMSNALLRLLFASMLSFCVARPLPGQEPSRGISSLLPSGLLTCPDVLLRSCCNNYCPKPLPCSGAHFFGCGECYCGKPCPSPKCFPNDRSCMDYCRKPCPDLCRPLSADFFQCVPAARLW
jgi:hypothetical protein